MKGFHQLQDFCWAGQSGRFTGGLGSGAYTSEITFGGNAARKALSMASMSMTS